MGRRATPGDLLATVVRAVGVVQVAALAVVALIAVVGAGVYGKSSRLDLFPAWLLVADGVLSVVAALYAVVLYDRGDLDDHTYDLRDPNRRRPR